MDLKVYYLNEEAVLSDCGHQAGCGRRSRFHVISNSNNWSVCTHCLVRMSYQKHPVYTFYFPEVKGGSTQEEVLQAALRGLAWGRYHDYPRTTGRKRDGDSFAANSVPY